MSPPPLVPDLQSTVLDKLEQTAASIWCPYCIKDPGLLLWDSRQETPHQATAGGTNLRFHVKSECFKCRAKFLLTLHGFVDATGKHVPAHQPWPGWRLRDGFQLRLVSNEKELT